MWAEGQSRTSPGRRWMSPRWWCHTWGWSPWLLCSTLWWWSDSAPGQPCPGKCERVTHAPTHAQTHTQTHTKPYTHTHTHTHTLTHPGHYSQWWLMALVQPHNETLIESFTAASLVEGNVTPVSHAGETTSSRALPFLTVHMKTSHQTHLFSYTLRTESSRKMQSILSQLCTKWWPFFESSNFSVGLKT